MGDWVRDVNRLRDLLAAIFSALERAFDYSTRSALVLLTGFQTPDSIRQAGPDGVAAHLHAAGAHAPSIPTMVDEAVPAAAEQTVALPTESTVAPLIARLAARLLDLDREIKNLDNRSATASRTTRTPRGSPAFLGSGRSSGRSCWPKPAAICRPPSAAPAGWPPMPAWPRYPAIPAGSAATCAGPSATTAGCAASSTWPRSPRPGPDGLSRAYDQRKRAEGKLHTAALIALACRLVDVIWALLRDGRQFHNSPPATADAA